MLAVMLNSLIQILPIIPVLILISLVLWLAVNRSRYFLILVSLYLISDSSATQLLSFLQRPQYIFAYSVYLGDILTVAAILAVLIFRITDIKRPANLRISTSPILISRILLIMTLSGIYYFSKEYGLGTGVNLWRSTLFSFSLLYYGLKSKFDLEDIKWISLLPGLILSCFVIFRFLTTGIGFVDGVDPSTGANATRASTSLGAYAILISLISIRLFWNKNKLLQFVSFTSLSSVILLLQHRTVWATYIFAVFLVLILGEGREARKVFLGRIITFVIIAFAGATVVITSSTLRSAILNTGTWSWREKRWADSIETTRSTAEWIIGGIFGPTPASNSNTGRIFAHSAYVDAIERFGFLGLTLILMFILYAILSLPRKMRVAKFARILAVTSLVYGISYDLPILAIMLLGVCIQYSFSHEFVPQEIDKRGSDTISISASK